MVRALAGPLLLAGALLAPRARADGGTPSGTTTAPAPVEQVAVRAAPRTRDVTEVTVPAAEARGMTGTEGDPAKVLENLPGLARPSFGSGQLVVWGSAPADTRTYVDGVEIPTLFHGNALRSTVNGDLVRDVTLTPGAYGPEYGGGLGGVVRIETNDLPDRGLHGYAAADVLDGSAMLTLAIGGRVRVGAAARYGWLEGALRAVPGPDVDRFFAIPRYADAQGKVQVALRPHESLDLVFLGSQDDLTETVPDPDPAHAQSETTNTSYQRLYLHYRHLLDDGANVDAVAFGGRDRNDLDASFGASPATLDQTTWRWGLRSSYSTRVADPVALTLGVDIEGSSASIARQGSALIPPREGDIAVFGQPPGGGINADAWNAGVIDAAPYLLARIQAGPLSVSPGLRVDGFLLQTSRQTPRVGATPAIGFEQLRGEVEPRVSARLRLTSALSALGAAGIYAQPPAPADLSAVFGNPRLGPETADHLSLGEALQITPSLSFETLAFYKWMSGLAVRDPSPTPRLAAALLQEGAGRAYGVELFLRQQPWQGISGWVALTLSRSERLDTPTSAWRLFDDDQPVVLTVVASKQLQAWTFGLRFRYATGLPRTPVIGAFYDAKDDLYQPVFGAQNSIRLPAFVQLDLRIDRSFALAGGATLRLYAEGLDVTNRSNGEEFAYSVDYTRRGTIGGLPAIGVIGARIER